MRIIFVLALTLFTSLAQSKSCFTKTYCSTGEAPRHVLCGRGQDCTRAKDLGLEFTQDCKASWWLGDAKEMRDYEVKDSQIVIAGRAGDEGIIYLLSADHKSITSSSNPKWVYSEAACNRNAK